MLVMLVVAGDDRRKADRAVSRVEMAGDEPAGSARILGSNMVERCVWLRCFAVDCCLAALQLLDFLPPPQFMECWARCWQRNQHSRYSSRSNKAVSISFL